MATRRKVCFTGPTRLKLAEEILRAAGCELVMGKNQDDFREYKYPRRELVELIGDAAVVFPSGRDIIGGEILDSCANLQAVVKSSIGIETVDVDAATDLGILCCNSPTPENYLGVAEATVGLMVMLSRHADDGPNHRDHRRGSDRPERRKTIERLGFEISRL
jgi:D-3-phosphoglycerate dehydrogenase